MTLRDLEYDAVVEKVAETMVPLMRKLLEDVKRELERYGYKTGPIIDLTDSEYRFEFGAVRSDGLDFEISVLMLEERVTEGTEGRDEEYGCSFMFGIHKQGGLLVADISPYNFTPRIWEPDLRDLTTVLARWELLTDWVFEADIVYLMSDEVRIEGR